MQQNNMVNEMNTAIKVNDVIQDLNEQNDATVTLAQATEMPERTIEPMPIFQDETETTESVLCNNEEQEEEEQESMLEECLHANFIFKYNEITGRLFYKAVNDDDFIELDERNLNSLRRFLRRRRIRISRTELLELLASDFTHKYNPYQEYFDALPDWDKQTDYIFLLSQTITTTNQRLWQRCFKKWMVAMVGCIIDENVVNQTAPIFSGGQGVGKTTWIGNLVPKKLTEYFYSGAINFSLKDNIIQLGECFLIDMDELENLSKRSIGDLKSVMTRRNIRIRRPYSRVAESIPRRASFIGSTNQSEFLRDETGSRRFLCFETETINNENEINIDLVYSQALSLYRSGFQYWFDAEEQKEIQANNEQFHHFPTEAHLLLNQFQLATPDAHDVRFMSTSQIAQELNLPCSNIILQRLGRVLSARRFINVTRNDRKVWAVRIINNN